MGKDTHYEYCWRDRKHHACAVAKIERLCDAIHLTNIAAEDAVAKREAEIERLRRLLREGLDHHDEYNWQQRVREALGEG